MEGEDDGMTKYDAYVNALSLLLMSYMGLRGVFFLITNRGVFDNSPTYDLMQSIVPKAAWGLLFLTAAVLLLVALLNESTAQYFFAMGGGSLTVLLLFFYALASFDTDASQVLPYTYLMLAGFASAIVVLGVLAWKNET